MFAREDPFGRKDLASLRECRDICLCPYEGKGGLKAQQLRAQGKAKPTPWVKVIHKKVYALQEQQYGDTRMGALLPIQGAFVGTPFTQGDASGYALAGPSARF